MIAARDPVPGATKTRLGAAIGMERAATLYRAFLQDLAARLTPTPIGVSSREDGREAAMRGAKAAALNRESRLKPAGDRRRPTVLRPNGTSAVEPGPFRAGPRRGGMYASRRAPG